MSSERFLSKSNAHHENYSLPNSHHFSVLFLTKALHGDFSSDLRNSKYVFSVYIACILVVSIDVHASGLFNVFLE